MLAWPDNIFRALGMWMCDLKKNAEVVAPDSPAFLVYVWHGLVCMHITVAGQQTVTYAVYNMLLSVLLPIFKLAIMWVCLHGYH